MKTKQLHYLLTLIGVSVSALSLSAQAQTLSTDPTITVVGTMAPDIYGSPSWADWANNGFYAAENGLTSYGAAGPSQFNVTTTPLPVAANFVTGFPSWMGQADPAAPYNNEDGNRASFVAVINGNGGLINMNGFGLTLTSSDPGNALGFSYPNNSIVPNDWTYDQYDIGLVFNNGKDISGGFTIIDSGSPDQPVNEIISLGAGDAYAGYLGDIPGDPAATDQEIINYDLTGIDSYGLTGTFSYGDEDSGSATLNFVAAPDVSSTWTLLGASLAGLVMLRRRFGRG